jgi:hypothetical protein
MQRKERERRKTQNELFRCEKRYSLVHLPSFFVTCFLSIIIKYSLPLFRFFYYHFYVFIMIGKFESTNQFVISVLKYALIFANCLLILDAIFLLISEKDSYQLDYISGRHPVSKLMLLMLYLDLYSILMILLSCMGIYSVKRESPAFISFYGFTFAIIAIAAFHQADMDAFLMESIISLMAFSYAILLDIKLNRERRRKHFLTAFMSYLGCCCCGGEDENEIMRAKAEAIEKYSYQNFINVEEAEDETIKLTK